MIIRVLYINLNGFGLCEGGAFQHYLSIEEPHFNITKNCQPKYYTPAFAKPVLAVVIILNRKFVLWENT